MAEKIAADQAKKKLQQDDALLVCAYADDEKCSKYNVDQAITLNELQAREDQIPKSKELMFYCG